MSAVEPLLERASILLVDDREDNLLALDAILEPLGHQLVAVTSGTKALKQLLLSDFACILLDVQMPELDGFELATLIKQRKRSQHIPIIFVTALSKDDRQVSPPCLGPRNTKSACAPWPMLLSHPASRQFGSVSQRSARHR